MNLVPYLRTQSNLHSNLERLLRDTANARWSDTEIYDAINDSLTEWDNRVLIPRYYAQTWVAGDYDYTMPDYLTLNSDPYIKRTVWGLDLESGAVSETLWRRQIAHDLVVNATGGQELLVDVPPPSVTGKIIWWMTNGPVPTTVATLSADIDADDTSLAITTKPFIGRAGYVYIGSEWIAYAGVTEGASTLTLNNLIRGINGTTAASHTSSSSVLWGIAVDRTDLYRQLFDQTMMHLHELPLTEASPTEKAHHERMLGFYEKRVMNFWKYYVPSRRPKMVLTRDAIGDLPSGDWWD